MRELPGGFKGCGMVGQNYALTHRYRLLAQAPETFPGGSMRIVSMRDFPVSSTMTGALFVEPSRVSMVPAVEHLRTRQMVPGSMGSTAREQRPSASS
jgi:hypothetical protein